ncbi:hypothetical protein DICSQDRAFT_172342 [Dichomitus squalens LYAD-421 SS1]|uniref:DUF6533 domain-containing protein n=2 Tax=Dichomitus squalens TaxID=114155 RepID=A0A4Q9N0Y3_9APHY|nr:uncharacterized protein DICSQDRAFT_172342 [Dichomitus squalens LYAD-421 SS1]EJF59023.1 hypothetical protein DICSQDRAFT_172342 [Dichomitus squalens LYAD-421 SS1]TBU34114.1 hypothetical protein BD311DRAFT_650789 [Dichomitus squalens]
MSYDPTTVELFHEFLVSDYCLVAANIFYIYDCLITLDIEVEYFWKGPFTGAKALFLANRYVAFVNVIVNYFQLIQFKSDKVRPLESASLIVNSCALYQRAGLALVYLQFLPPAVFSSLRAYALSKNWPLALFILILSLVPYGVNMADYGYGLTGFVDPVFGCLNTDVEPLNISIILIVAFQVTCLITSDVLLIIITWIRLYRRHIFAAVSRSLTFERVLIQNGTLYFIILLVMNVLHLSFSMASISGNGGYSAVTAFTPVVTSTLVSRFLLDLQRAKHKPQHLDIDQSTFIFTESSGLASMNFASRVMGSIGETLAGDTEVDAFEIDALKDMELSQVGQSAERK